MGESQDLYKDLKFVTNKISSIPENQREHFDQIIKTYMGDMQYYLSIAENSEIFKETEL